MSSGFRDNEETRLLFGSFQVRLRDKVGKADGQQISKGLVCPTEESDLILQVMGKQWKGFVFFFSGK